MYTYLWDVEAEGIEPVLDRIQAMGLDGVNVAFTYHAGRFLLPHNPKSRLYFPEDGVLYFQPDPSHFEGLAIQPPISRHVGTENLTQRLADACAQRGLELNAWVIFLHNSRLGFQYPKCTVVNPLGDHEYTWLCPANPDVRAYYEAVVASLTHAFDIGALLAETPEFPGFIHRYHHEKIMLSMGPATQTCMNLCFCRACLAEATARGIDGESLRRQLTGLLSDALTDPDDPASSSAEGALADILAGGDDAFAAYVEMRREIVHEFLRGIEGAMRGSAPIELLSFHPPKLRPIFGIDPERLQGAVDRMQVLAYTADAAGVRSALLPQREAMPSEIELTAALSGGVPGPRTASDLREQVAACRELGVERLSFYNYGLMPSRSFEWIRQAIR